MKKWLWLILALSNIALANDSTGFVATGGVSYIKNEHIAMQSEELFLSKNLVRVKYQYQNLTEQPITQTILFPMPLVQSHYDWDFADIKGLLTSFKITANGKIIQPKLHVRAFMYPQKNGELDFAQPKDVTAAFKQCGLSDAEIINNWTHKIDEQLVWDKLEKCQNSMINRYKTDEIHWASQVIYSWEQRFPAHEIIEIQHQYQPLVGSGFVGKELLANYCASNEKFDDQQNYFAMGYVLKTGANWAKPIKQFKLTVQRDKNEQVFFCWKGNSPQKSQQGNKVQFTIEQQNFVPTQDLELLFVPKM